MDSPSKPLLSEDAYWHGQTSEESDNESSASSDRHMDATSQAQLSDDADGHHQMSGESENEFHHDSGSTSSSSSENFQARPSSSRPRRVSGIFGPAMPPSHSPLSDVSLPACVKLFDVPFLAASLFDGVNANGSPTEYEVGYPYLTFTAGETFVVLGEKEGELLPAKDEVNTTETVGERKRSELWLAKNEDDATETIGWVRNKYFAKLS